MPYPWMAQEHAPLYLMRQWRIHHALIYRSRTCTTEGCPSASTSATLRDTEDSMAGGLPATTWLTTRTGAARFR